MGNTRQLGRRVLAEHGIEGQHYTASNARDIAGCQGSGSELACKQQLGL